ncbi:MAG TPA: PhzF family phenazine biosynthesis protein [Gaiellaceae bacterium]|nr:PhzF family phenazine biosynthesis protein [Gaiellaceae bacterium]
MAGFRYVFVDVFTDVPLAGNQLAVFTDAREIPERLLQQLAAEIGFSETTFVLPPEAGGHARVRIFNPTSEMPFAGHPVLGTAFVLGAPLQLGVIELETGRGTVAVALERDPSGRLVFGRMAQPIPTVQEVADPAPVFAALGIRGSELPVERYDNGAEHVFVALPSEAAVAALRPDLEAVEALGGTGVNCFAGSGSRWKTRMFGPAVGVPEDPATGSAAGPLACHLARHGRIDWGDEIEITQGVEIGRPSTLFARADGGGGLIDRVEVGGSAVAVARGEYRLPSDL